MNAPQFRIKRHVTLAVLKIKANAGPRYFKFAGAMHKGKKIDDQKEAATLIEATDLVTGEHGVIIVPTVLQKDLEEHYPGGSYAGKSFQIVITRVPEKRYNHVSFAELEDAPEPPAFDAAAAAAMAAQHADEGEGEGEGEGESGPDADEAESAAQEARASRQPSGGKHRRR